MDFADPALKLRRYCLIHLANFVHDEKTLPVQLLAGMPETDFTGCLGLFGGETLSNGWREYAGSARFAQESACSHVALPRRCAVAQPYRNIHAD